MFQRFCSRILPAFAAALLCPLVFAQKTIRVPADQPTIQGALNAANDGDTVSVAPGTYTGSFYTNAKGVQLVSTGGVAVTILDGGGVGPVMTMSGASQHIPAVSGFTIQNGGISSNGVGGAVIAYGTPVILSNNVITAAYCAGIAITAASSAQVTGNKINRTKTTGCVAGEGLGSGIVVTGGRRPSPGTPSS